jgi:hypothetical protein
MELRCGALSCERAEMRLPSLTLFADILVLSNMGVHVIISIKVAYHELK